MRAIRIILALFLFAVLTGCATSKFQSYDGPEVTRVLIYKSERTMYLMHHDRILAEHQISLGFAPEGHKRIEGDGRTPEGQFFINRRNPNSSFHLSLGINYPRPEDIAAARELGKSPGGDIFIHGNSERSGPRARNRDWTWGCIAVTDREMERIYAMVQNGTVVDIYP